MENRNMPLEFVNKLRMLIIEDSSIVQMVYRVLFSKMEVIDADYVSNGQDAFSKNFISYDLIMSDQELGDSISGLDILKKIRDEYKLTIPFFIISSHAWDSEFIQLCKKQRADEVLIKPITAKQLKEVIQKYSHFTVG